MNKFGVFTLTALGTLGVVAGGTAIALSTPQVQDKLKDHYSETIVVEVPGQTEPEEPTININLADYEFTLDEENKTATITKYNGTDANLVLPSTLSVTEEGKYIAGEDYSVTAIGERAFQSNNFIHNVVIPESVTTINRYAFSGCICLLDISLPDSITSLGESCFSGCSSLKSVQYSENLTEIPYYGFRGCTSLESFIIPNNVTTIDSYAFQDCTGLKSVLIPDGVITIDNSAFNGCSSLESIVIPNSVTTVGTSVFSNCTSLKSVQLSNSMTTISNFLFSKCTSLESITLPASMGNLYNVTSGLNCGNLKEIIIESGATYSSLTKADGAYCAMLFSNESLTTIKVLASIIDEEERTNSLLDNPENYTRTLDDDGVYYTYTKVVNEETV